MKVLYHLTVLPPKMPECEALSQEIAALRHHFEGDLIYLNPNQQSPIYIPRLAFGFHKLRQLRRREADFHLHHLYNPDAFPFPVLRFLKRPVIYTISSGVSQRRPNIDFFASLAAVAVSDERSFNWLKEWGLDNLFLVRTGIDTKRFTFSAVPLQKEIRLLVASAPWTPAQFQTKGIEALLQAAQLNPDLQLIFLWRGVLTAEMKERVQQMSLEAQVTVIDRQVDVNRMLGRVHASVTLASSPGIIKSYPHSLLDSLAAGKPVLVGQAIPMADYVEQTQCGVVVEQVTPYAILRAIESLKRNYKTLQTSAGRVGQKDFSLQAMIDSFQTMYRWVRDKAS